MKNVWIIWDKNYCFPVHEWRGCYFKTKRAAQEEIREFCEGMKFFGEKQSDYVVLKYTMTNPPQAKE